MSYSTTLKKIKKNILFTRLIFTRIRKAIRSFIIEISKKEGAVKGDVFEDYTRRYIFPKQQYLLEHRTPNFNRKDFIRSSLFPDFVFKTMDDRPISFAVEVKFKKTFYNNKLTLCKDWQMKRYKDFGIAFNMPVFIFHGVGGTPYNPKDLYIIPLTEDLNHVLSIKQVEQYRASKKTAINRDFLRFKINQALK